MITDEPMILGEMMDKLIVKKEYIFARGTDHLLNDMTFEGREFSKPSMGIWKVHPEHPITINNHTKNPFGKDNYVTISHDHAKPFISPAAAWKRQDMWDATAFFLLPRKYEADGALATIDDAFITKDGKGPVTLFNIPHEYALSSGLHFAVPTMQTQLSALTFRTFLYHPHKIQTLKDHREWICEGTIDIPLKAAQDVLYNVIVPTLEKRYLQPA